MHYVDLIFIVPLSIMAWQDFQDRAISWVLFPLMGVMLLGQAVMVNALPGVFFVGCTNLMLVTLQWGLLWGYFQIRHRRLRASLPLGTGDIAFWTVASFGFALLPFILFFTSSLLFSLLGHFLVRLFFAKRYAPAVPLAGWQALFWIMTLILNHAIPSLGVEHWETFLGEALANEY